MKARLILISLIGAIAVFAACNLQRCSEGASCAISNGAGPSAIPSPTVATSPTPTPTPTPSPVAESCDFDILQLQPVDGLAVTIAQQPIAHLSLTPYQTITCKAQDTRIECVGKNEGQKVRHEVSEACNLKVSRLASLIWSNSSPASVTVGTGYEPSIVRTAPGLAVVAATLEGQVSNAVIVR